MMNASRPSTVPFSRAVDVATVGDEPMQVTITADDAEMAALARLDGLAALDRLEADLTISRDGRSGLRVTGAVKARVRQTCVVSLDSFDAEIVEPVDVHFLPEAELTSLESRSRKADDSDASEEDLPDPIVGGRIDLGALAAEFLALGLDPYPRKPGVAYVEPEPRPEDTKVSPFAALGNLKTNRPL